MGWIPTSVSTEGILPSEPESIIRALEDEIVRLEKELQIKYPERSPSSIEPLDEILLTGEVILRPNSPGSKNDYDRVSLLLDDGRVWLLRRPNVAPTTDQKLYALLGKRITTTGYIHGYCFMVTSALIRKPR